MDRTPDCGSGNPGSIPGEGIAERKQLIVFVQESKGFSLSSMRDRKPPATVVEIPGEATVSGILGWQLRIPNTL